MASVLYNSFKTDLFNGVIDLETDTLKVMLVTSAYAPDVDAHNRRDDVTNEVAATGGYTAGGEVIACTVTQDNATNKAVATFADVLWAASTITARGAVVYRSTGVAANDQLIGYIDFGADKTSVASDFTFHMTAPLDLT